jgi:hypothetical protein
MPRKLPLSVGTKLAAAEHEAICSRALSHGLRLSEYLRFLVLADLHAVTDDRLFYAFEAEHTRLALLAAQQGKALNATTLRDLRSQAILNAPALVEQTIRVLKQQRNGGQ